AAVVSESQPPFMPVAVVEGAFIDADASLSQFPISSRTLGGYPPLFESTASSGRPWVGAGASRFLVAGGQSPRDVVATSTEIRGVRVTRPAGRLDPDGGLLLATSLGGAITGGPVAAFDGTVWLVAWVEDVGGTSTLRAVAVRDDGTVVDPMPRTIVSGVSPGDPALASLRDG